MGSSTTVAALTDHGTGVDTRGRWLLSSLSSCNQSSSPWRKTSSFPDNQSHMARAACLLLALWNAASPPVQALSLASRAPNGAGAIDTPSGGRGWERSCLIHRPCRRVARRLPRCPEGIKAITARAVQELPGDGRTVSVRGALHYGDFATTAVACEGVDSVKKRQLRSCCNLVSGPILVGEGTDDGQVIHLEGVGCRGDESRTCCDLIVSGQQVVATGELHENHHTFGGPSRYSLGPHAKICSLESATGP